MNISIPFLEINTDSQVKYAWLWRILVMSKNDFSRGKGIELSYYPDHETLSWTITILLKKY